MLNNQYFNEEVTKEITRHFNMKKNEVKVCKSWDLTATTSTEQTAAGHLYIQKEKSFEIRHKLESSTLPCLGVFLGKYKTLFGIPGYTRTF